ncbi:large conductance mechanosensitive channel protein MscL [Staphylococcus massiliensis]|uniref:Large-conductance mechanosensitive channel n=1 Tax=Staphylococcus massiliensis S46 TaxID=1229783 RepID=K9AV04_9STAP|nr:large conductance mechanosensitive channel protein MscL [Staphylococcus massiliensis]EKU46372.1 large-conductance mechanosensitive channel [Staphylococcus massiliensis S46]PNZ99430.1 large conductance mechanosensitive channel protein MscL [Staphylococcus massiliensis CCUG 55927]
MSLIKEFKEFALKGNVLELAIAVVMGAAFNKIISSLVENVIMPLIGLIFGEVDFAKNWSIMGIKYGLFIQSVIDFIIIAFALFVFIKIANTLMKPKVEEENTLLLTEIRDLLRQQNK